MPLSYRLGLALVALAAAGCATVQQRFSPDVATSFVRDDMRKLTTPTLELYYPAHRKDAALRIAGRLEYCLEQLYGKATTQERRDRPRVYLTSANFNNAYVFPRLVGYEQHMVLPTGMTLDLFDWLNLGLNEVDDVACHEAVHYVHLQQTNAFWWAMNGLTGGVLDPNLTMEGWFIEGLATYYEGRLGRANGRPWAPAWRGMFTATVEHHGGRVSATDLAAPNREQPFGAHYLFGSFFIDWLAQKYGEEKLWQVIDKQGRSVFFPFGVTLRFKSVYGKSIGALVDEWSEELAAKHQVRPRPASQQVVHDDLGRVARLAVSRADGTIAAVLQRPDEEVRLELYEADGKVRASVPLTQLLPERRWVIADPILVSGLSFTGDGRHLFVFASDVDPLMSINARLWKVDARTGEVVRTWEDLVGSGGSVHPDGGSYVYVESDGDRAHLTVLSLADGKRSRLWTADGHVSLAAPAFSPDGRKVAFSRWSGQGFDLALLEEGKVSSLTEDGRFNYGPRWVDDGRLAFIRERDGRGQVHLLELATKSVQPLSDAPHLALDAAPTERRVLFLNRDGLRFSLDAVEVGDARPVAEATPAPAPQAAPSPEAAVKPVQVVSDEKASSLEGLFVPALHVPFVMVAPNQKTQQLTDVFASLSVMGTDRLGRHTWALNGAYQFGSDTSSASFEYGNTSAAPWFLHLGASRTEEGTLTDWQAFVSASRYLYVTPVELRLEGVDRRRRPTEEAPTDHLRLLGPRLSLDYYADDSTLYVTRRAFWSSLSGAGYLVSGRAAFPVVDLRAELGGAVPLPWLKRHSLRLQGTGRAQFGAAEPLMRVGGALSAIPVAGKAPDEPKADPAGPMPVPGALAFSEALRGYEDSTAVASRAAILGATYRYRFVLDRGWASTLYVLPSFFVHELDVEAFGAAAFTDAVDTPTRRAAGGRVQLNLSLGGLLGFGLYYQGAYRFDGGLAPLHLVGVAL